MVRCHFVCIGLILCGALTSIAQQRQPIRVGGNRQESKLIHKVEPVYPEAAIEQKIQGWVILVITVDEKGKVAHLEGVEGHPLLVQAAVEAVRQWRYLPTYLDRKPVSIMSTVVLFFRLGSRLVFNQKGVLRSKEDGIEGDALIRQLKGRLDTVIIRTSAKAPYRLLEKQLSKLKEHDIRFAFEGGTFVFHNDRIFYVLSALSRAPELALDTDRLADLASASGMLPTAISLDSNGIITLSYQLFLAQNGVVLFVKRLQLPEIPEVEAELARTHAVTPALLDSNPVPAVVTVEIPIPYERIKRR